MRKFKIIFSDPFYKELRHLSKKYRSVLDNVEQLSSELETNPKQGTPLGKNCYKIRMAITSKNKGKSAGSRVITYVQINDEEVTLLTIYDKSEKEDITAKELDKLLKELGLE